MSVLSVHDFWNAQQQDDVYQFALVCYHIADSLSFDRMRNRKERNKNKHYIAGK